MFKRQMKFYQVERPKVKVNEYGENIISYVYSRNAEMAIAVENKIGYNGNDTAVLNVEYMALTPDKEIKKGDRIDGKYLVEYIETFRRYLIVHMKEVDNDGNIQ